MPTTQPISGRIEIEIRVSNRAVNRHWIGTPDRHGKGTVARVMTDNGACYKAFAFRDACRKLGLKHIRTKPYTPKTNGKAERFIQTALREWAYALATPTPIAEPLPHLGIPEDPAGMAAGRNPCAGIHPALLGPPARMAEPSERRTSSLIQMARPCDGRSDNRRWYLL